MEVEFGRRLTKSEQREPKDSSFESLCQQYHMIQKDKKIGERQLAATSVTLFAWNSYSPNKPYNENFIRLSLVRLGLVNRIFDVKYTKFDEPFIAFGKPLIKFNEVFVKFDELFIKFGVLYIEIFGVEFFQEYVLDL